MADQNHTYEVIESKVWRNSAGRTASIYGALPYIGEVQKYVEGWEIVSRGWTVRNKSDGSVGLGRMPWETREAAQAWVDGAGPIAETLEQRRDRLANAIRGNNLHNA